MMDSFELNKLIGALLAVVFVVFSVSLLSDSIFSTHAPETPGYAIAVPEETGGEAVAEEEGPSIVDLLQNADAAAGQAAFRPCAACHNVEEGGPNMAGPNLWDVLNRPIASHEGFNYSAAMREFSQGGSVVWDYDHLSEFLRAPRSYIQGTAMAFAGIRNPEQEANVIAYLRSLSGNPAPLPEPAAEEAAPAEGEAAPAAEEGAAPAAGEETPAEPATEAAPATDAAPAAGEEGTDAETQAEPAAPSSPDDGTSASPETDAGTTSPAEPEAPAEETAPAQQ